MHWVLFGFLIFFTCTVHSFNLTSDNDTKSIARVDGRIVNGVRAIPGQFPYIVSLRRTHGTHFCGGTLITVRWVVSAAHCMFDQDDHLIGESSFYIVAGDIQLNPPTLSRQQRYVLQRIVNPHYNVDTLMNDIALIQLQTAVKITSFVQPIPIQEVRPLAGTNCTVAGWGYPSEDYPVTSTNLMYIYAPIIDQRTCQRLLNGIMYMGPNILCAGYVEGGKDSCQGDSGGPMVCGKNLTGIVSGGLGCARPLLPGFYTNVAFYKDWIKRVVDSSGRNTTYNNKTSFESPWKTYSKPNSGNLQQFVGSFLISMVFMNVLM